MRRYSIGIVLKLILFTILLVGLDAGALVAAAQGRVADAKSQASGRQEGSAMADLKRRMYVSGHSLTNPRTIELLGRMAGAAGVDLVWNMQYLEGSSIRQRREGRLGTAERRPYNNGADRSGQPADVLAEFASRNGDGRAIDTLLVTEQHAILGALVWQDTIGSLRDLHDSFVKSNPGGQSVFFAPWLSLDDRAAPSRWVAYERAAAPVWSCMVGVVNRSLERDGRRDRVRSISMGLAMAELVASAATKGTAIFEAIGPKSRLKGLLTDDVHLGPIGDYYVAAVLFQYLFPGLQPASITVPSVSPGLMRELDAFAGRFALEHADSEPAMSASKCRTYVKAQFVDTFVSYYTSVDFKKNQNAFSAAYSKWKMSRNLNKIYRFDNESNPFSGE